MLPSIPTLRSILPHSYGTKWPGPSFTSPSTSVMFTSGLGWTKAKWYGLIERLPVARAFEIQSLRCRGMCRCQLKSENGGCHNSSRRLWLSQGGEVPMAKLSISNAYVSIVSQRSPHPVQIFHDAQAWAVLYNPWDLFEVCGMGVFPIIILSEVELR